MFVSDAAQALVSLSFRPRVQHHSHCSPAQLRSINGVRIYGPSPEAAQGRAALATFNVEGIHPTDISTLLDSAGVAVRSGHLCTQPVHRHLGIASSVRASPYIYNTRSEVDAFVDALKDTIQFFREVGA